MIPDSLINFFPPAAQDYYKKVYEDSFNRTGDAMLASKVAWNMVKMRLKFREDGSIEAMEIDFIDPKLISMPMEAAEDVIVKNHDNGEVEFDLKLATTEGRRSDGRYFTEVELEQIAMQINAEGSTFPDIDHEVLTNLINQYGPNTDVIANAIKREKGIFKSIKAIVKDGALWVKAFLDKRYRNYADKFKGVSIEVLAKNTPEGRLLQPRYLGFTFTNNPQLPGAGVAH